MRLKELRKQNGFNQKEIAKILNTTQQQISKYEKGEQELPVHHLITLAKLYKVSTDYILELTDNRYATSE